MGVSENFHKEYYGQLIGFTITGVGIDNSDKTRDPIYWLILDNETKKLCAFISSDPEINGPGFLAIQDL